MAKEISPEYLDAIVEYASIWTINTRVNVIDLLIELADNPLAVELLTNWHKVHRDNIGQERHTTKSYIETLLEHGERDYWLLDGSFYSGQEKAYMAVLDDLIMFPASKKAEKEDEQCNE